MRKGQVTIISILSVVVLLIVFAAFLPTITSAINMTSSYLTEQPMALVLLGMIPLFIVLSIIISIFRGAERQYP